MIEQFQNIQDLIFKIKKEKSTNNITQNRFPVRFIFLSSFETLQDLVIELNKINIEKLEIETYLPHDDGWVSKQNLIEVLQKIETKKDYIILPFSEIARFYDKDNFNNLFSQLTEISNIENPNRRLYIPLVGVKERFETEFYNKFSRKKEYSFLWEIFEETKRAKIFLYDNKTKIDFKITKIQTVKNTKAWLTIWNKDLNDPTLCISESLTWLSKYTIPDKIFDFKKLETIKDIIEEIYKINIPINYTKNENKFWHTLLEKINKQNYNSFSDFVKNELNTRRITIKNFIDLWLKSKNNFEKWILINQIKQHECLKNKYLCKVLNKLTNFDNLSFFKLLWSNIFTFKNIDKANTTEREELIKQFYKIEPLQLPKAAISQIEKKVDNIENSNRKIDLLLGILPFEKKKLFQIAKYNPEVISDKYPELYNYLQNFEFSNLKEENNWIIDYFKSYQTSKINNKYSDTVKTFINTKNNNEENFYKWYHTFEDVNTILKKFESDEIFWIDALGIEWTSLIEYFLNQKGYNIEDKQIARVDLPTTTDANRYEKATYIQDFDLFIHSNIYKYPQTIIDEIEKLSEIINNKINLDNNKRAVIISDHGLSALSRLQESIKYKFKTEHEGRYAKVENINSFSEDENFIKHDNYLIALKHNSLSTKPIREVHGGCTPEEVLVPVIVFSTIEKTEDKTEYNIKLLSSEIDKKNPLITFNILPKPKYKVYLFQKNIKKELKYIENNRYSLKLENPKSGKQSIKLMINDFEQNFTINIKSGFTEEDLF